VTAGIIDYRCGLCGEEFGSNCYPGDISCVGCDARLCPCCGTWFTELGEVSAAPEGHGFLKVAEVAVRLRVSKQGVYRMIESGELPAKRFGGSYRVSEAGLRAYVDGADAVPLEPAVAGG
jgi:excisionase family DNA binding protein